MDNFKLINTNDIPTQTAHTPELRHDMMYKYKCRSRREFFLKSETATEKFRGKETGNGLVSFNNNSRNNHNETQEGSTHATASCKGNDKIPPCTKTGPQIEKVLVRDENTN